MSLWMRNMLPYLSGLHQPNGRSQTRDEKLSGGKYRKELLLSV